MEALRDNLDVISLTEHLEYQPHKVDIPHPDRNRSYEIALKEAKDHDLILVHGSEITRQAPIGHNNAIFIEDANKLLVEDAEESFAEAKEQGAFVFGTTLLGMPNHQKVIRFLAIFKKSESKRESCMESR